MNRTIKQQSYWLKRGNRHCGLVLPERMTCTNVHDGIENTGTSTEIQQNSDDEVHYFRTYFTAISHSVHD